jgi:hypothetical protein
VSGNVAPANERALEEVTASFHASGAQGQLGPMNSYLDDALGLLDRLFKAAVDAGRMGSVIEILALRAGLAGAAGMERVTSYA